jgi:hypothetical protein
MQSSNNDTSIPVKDLWKKKKCRICGVEFDAYLDDQLCLKCAVKEALKNSMGEKHA